MAWPSLLCVYGSAADQSGRRRTRWRSSPMPSTWLTSTSPGGRKRVGLRPPPTPAGVPVKIMSPGQQRADRGQPLDERRDAEHDQSLVRPCCTVSPSIPQPQFEVVGVGELVGRDEPRPDGCEARERTCRARTAGPGPTAARSRSEMSWPTVRPATYDPGVRCRQPRSARRPITATSSTSQSTLPRSGATTGGDRPGQRRRELGERGRERVGDGEVRLRGVLGVVQPDREHLRRGRRRRSQVGRLEGGSPAEVGLRGPPGELVPHLVDTLRFRAEPPAGRLLDVNGTGLGEHSQTPQQVSDAHR